MNKTSSSWNILWVVSYLLKSSSRNANEESNRNEYEQENDNRIGSVLSRIGEIFSEMSGQHSFFQACLLN